MVIFNLIRQYVQKVNQIKFPVDKQKPFFIVYLSENSNFVDDLPKLNLRKIDIRDVIVPYTKIPLTRLLPDDRKPFRRLGWLPRSSTDKVPAGKNIVFDLSKYMDSVEMRFRPKTWRMRVGGLLKGMIIRSFTTVPDNYQKILLYSVNLDKPHNDFMDRKIFPILLQIREGILPYDHLLLNIVSGGSSYYRLLIKNREVNISKVRALLRGLTFEDLDNVDYTDEETTKATTTVISKIEPHIKPENKEKVQNIVRNYLTTQPKEVNRINKIDDEDLKFLDKEDKENKDLHAMQIAASAMLSSLQGNQNKAKNIVKNIPPEKMKNVISAIDKQLIDEILEAIPTMSTSSEVAVQLNNPAKAVDNKTPTHIFEKRQIDFQKNLKKDVENSFEVLKKKDLSLSVENVNIVDKIQKPSELRKSDTSTIEVQLKDKDGKSHNIKLDVPKIQDDGTFNVNGQKKCLINQIVLIPITFPKAYESRFEASYSTFRINSKRTKREKYLETYFGAYWMPLFPILAYAFGWEETCKRYDIKYTISKDKPKKGEPFTTRINKEDYLKFENVDTELKHELCQSLIHANIYKYGVETPFGTKQFFNDFIIEYTGRINSTYLIQMTVDNVVDPVAKQVLLNKQLPFKLEDIMQYMASKVVTGFKQDRNDIEHQRIRNSEVLIHLIQKQLLAAYTLYREQLLSGNKKAKFEIPQSAVYSQFTSNSQIVVNMEYANPVEEMSTMTRVSPVGKNVGGIPDKRSLQNEARNVHDSMFGNIDPLDTPEGDNVGIVQHLTVDAFISSSRGLFTTKKKNNDEGSGLLSTSASLIPFVENDDGARVMFGCNQGRQSVPLRNPEPPLVQSGYESLLTNVLSQSFIKKSPCDGKILKVTTDFISIMCNGKEKINIDITPVHLKSGSGKNTLSVFNPVVKEGQTIRKGQIIAEGSCIANGSISLGRTLLTAVMPYKGYNFEDGIVISESLANSGKLTSLHGIEIEAKISEKDKLNFINHIGKDTIKGEPLLKKSIGELGELIGFEEEDESQEIHSGQLITKSPGGKIVDIEVFSNATLNKFPLIAELAKRTDNKLKRPSDEKYTDRGLPVDGILVRFKIEQEMHIGVGDKITNRHGAKGIISYIEKDENMPVTPWGERIDIIVNPIGIIGRMNVGQLYELYTGLISKSLGLRIVQLKDKAKVLPYLEKVFNILDQSKNKEMSKRFMTNFRSMNDRQFMNFVEQVRQRKGMSILIPPFKSPDYKDISKALKILGLETGYKLKLPEFNMDTHVEVPVGYMYFLKLEHIGKEKIHGRSEGPTVSKTQQPTAGKAQEGGQRMGEMDTYSFISYNALTTLAESFGALSDDSKSRNEMVSEIVKNGETTFRAPQKTPVKELLNFYFTGLMIERR